MCARTPIWRPTCGDTLLWKAYRQAVCLVGHTVSFDDLPIEPGQKFTTQYHGAGRSQLMRHTECRHCDPLQSAA